MATKPKVKISETNPGEVQERAAVALEAGTVFTLDVKNSRAAVIEAVKNSRSLPLPHQEVILAEIEALPPHVGLVWVSACRHPHKSGGNFTFTVAEV